MERHNEILRQAVHRTESRVKVESIISTLAWILTIVTFMHSSLICINGQTLYNKLFGWQPPNLPPLEGGYIAELDASKRTGVPQSELKRATQRDLVGAREISATNIIEATAPSRSGES